MNKCCWGIKKKRKSFNIKFFNIVKNKIRRWRRRRLESRRKLPKFFRVLHKFLKPEMDFTARFVYRCIYITLKADIKKKPLRLLWFYNEKIVKRGFWWLKEGFWYYRRIMIESHRWRWRSLQWARKHKKSKFRKQLLWRRKSFRFENFLKKFLNKKMQGSNRLYKKMQIRPRLLFKKYIKAGVYKVQRFGFFWYKKLIFRKAFIRYYQVTVKYLSFLQKKNKVHSIITIVNYLESRLDILIVRLSYFRCLNNARRAIKFGIVFVNFKRCVLFNFLVKAGDIIHISKKIRRYAPTFFWRGLWSLLWKSGLYKKQKKLKYLRPKKRKAIMRFFNKYLYRIKSKLLKKKIYFFNIDNYYTLSKNYYVCIVSFDILRLRNFRRKLKNSRVSLKMLSFFIHTHF